MWAQSPTGIDSMVQRSVQRIVQCSGLRPNFIVRPNAGVKTAIAFVEDRQRVIEYSPAFVAGLLDSTRTDRSIESVLAHEVAHHLLGHTIDPSTLRPGDELACDRYSGFVLFALGADLPQALSAIGIAGNVHGTRTHPPRHARETAIRQGWEEARALREGRDPGLATKPPDFRYTVRFNGDENTYYVDEERRLVWFNELSEPIELGRFNEVKGVDHPYELTWQDEVLHVDAALVIWRPTALGMPMKAGRMDPFSR